MPRLKITSDEQAERVYQGLGKRVASMQRSFSYAMNEPDSKRFWIDVLRRDAFSLHRAAIEWLRWNKEAKDA